MSSRKNKKAQITRETVHTKDFVKDWKRLTHSGRYDMNRLKEVMIKLFANDEPLGAEYKDHALLGEWSGFRECHIGGDFLLIYSIDEQTNTLIFTRIGTHSELFK